MREHAAMAREYLRRWCLVRAPDSHEEQAYQLQTVIQDAIDYE